jgi:hypothetical protein
MISANRRPKIEYPDRLKWREAEPTVQRVDRSGVQMMKGITSA